MTSSGLYDFQLSNASVILEAFDRIEVHPPQIDRHMMESARRSLNFELLSWSNETWNFWKTTGGTIPLVAGQATYTLPLNLVTLEELYYSMVDGGGAGIDSDRIMVPIERTQYAQIVNKLQGGIPTQYWFQMLLVPQVTIWMVPQAGQSAPRFVLNWYGLQQIQDATLSSGETPDIHYRATDALCARLAARLAEKFRPDQLKDKMALADIAWNNLQRRDQEPGPTSLRFNISSYGTLRQ